MHRLRPALAALLAMATLISLSGLAGAQGDRRLYLPALRDSRPSPTATASATASATRTVTSTSTATSTATATATSTRTATATESATSAAPTVGTTSTATATESATSTSTATATATESATSTSTATATATATESATSTSTATATATTAPARPPAGSCRVYPVGVWSQYLQGDKFVNPGADVPGQPPTNWRTLSGGVFEGYTARRVYVQEQASLPGGFVFLQWLPPSGTSSSAALAASMRSPGNIEQGFEEAPWPDGFPNRPEFYPTLPGELNPGDWVRSNTGLSSTTEVRAEIEDHILSQRLLLLPISDEVMGEGQSSSYRVVRLGLFAVLDYDKYNGKDYFDMAFLGALPDGPCAYPQPPGASPTPTSTPTPTATEAAAPAALAGGVQLQPEYADRSSEVCVVVTEPWQDTISASEFVNLPDYGLVYPIVGEVLLTDANGVEIRAPIRAGANERLTYSFQNLAAGSYELTAYLLYKHPTETQPRLYAWLYENEQNVSSVSVAVAAEGQLVRDLRLKPFAPACGGPESR